MTTHLQRGFIILLLLGINACGFQLRGSNLENLDNANIFIQAAAGSNLALELKRQLSFAGVNITDSAGHADYVIHLSDESYDKDVLSVSSETGKVAEYELITNSRLSITGTDDKHLVNNETISARRDYIFDQDSVLGKFDEEQKIREEINQQLAASIVRRLRAVTR